MEMSMLEFVFTKVVGFRMSYENLFGKVRFWEGGFKKEVTFYVYIRGVFVFNIFQKI